MTNIRNSVILDASLDTTSDNHATEKVHLTTTRALCDLSHYNINEIRQLRKNKRENAASAIWEKTSSDQHDFDNTQNSRFENSAPLEPFHMEEESKYGRFNEDGFFEFSKNSKSKKYIQDNVSPTSDDEEDNIQDPWFESLKDPLHNNEQVISSHIKISEHANVRSPQLEENHEEKTNYDLLLELADCLVERDETVSQALRRLSNESEANQNMEGKMDKKGGQIKKVKRKKMSIENQSIFNTITEICDVLMLDRKFHDVFNMTRDAIVNEAEAQKRQFVIRSHVSETNTFSGSSEPEDFFLIRFKNPKQKMNHGGPYSMKQLHEFFKKGFISKERPAQILQVLSDKTPVNGLWVSWDTFAFPCLNPQKEFTENDLLQNGSSEDVSEDYSDDAADIEAA